MNERDFKDKINQLRVMQEELFTAEIKGSETWRKVNTNCPPEYEELKQIAFKFDSELKAAEIKGCDCNSENTIRLLHKLFLQLKEAVENTTWL